MTNRVPRGVWITGAWVCGIGASVVVLALVVGIAGGMLPTGTRTEVQPVAPSDEQYHPSPYWYTRDEADALSAELAGAVDGSDWCVGWSIVLTGEVPYEDTGLISPYQSGESDSDGFGSDLDTGGLAGVNFGEYADVGSNRGPGRSARTCGHWAEVEVVYRYTAASASLEDNARFRVLASDSRTEGALRAHRALQVTVDALLHEDRGDNTDDVIGNAIAALPLALAEQGRIDPLSVEPVATGTAGAVTFADSEGEGGSDVLVANRTALLVGALVALAGLLLLCMAWGQVPARWFRPAPSPFGTVAAAPGPAAGRPGNPRRALKDQLERAQARQGVGEQGGS